MPKKAELEITSLFKGQLPLVYERFYATNGIQTFPPHWHKQYELIRIVRGSFQLTLVNDTFIMKPGDIAFVDCNEAHDGVSLSEDLIYDMIQVKPDAIGKYASSFQPLEMLLKRQISINKIFRDENVCDIFEKVAPIYELSNSCRELLFLGLLFEMFGFILSAHISDINPLSYKENFFEIIDFINEHCAEKLTVEGLAKQFSFHVSYFSHKFKEVVGISPNRYIIIARLKLAEEYLKKTKFSIELISQKCGFESTSYFIKKFKNYTGTTPAKYRSNNVFSHSPENIK